MGKGDGKQRRKKKEDLPPPPPAGQQQPSGARKSTPPSKPQASRVDKDQLLSVRKQIALAKAYKAFQKQGAAPKQKVRTSFRKNPDAEPKADAVNYTQAVDEQARGEFDLGELPLLYVDGYNVIGLWPRLKKRRDKNDMDGARRLLLDDLVEFAPRRFEVVCVFDAPGAGELTDKEDEHFGVRVVYACTSADEYIERATMQLQGERNVWAATNDNAMQVAARTHGANVVTSNWLVRELRGSRQATATLVQEFNEREFRRAGGRSTLWDSLDERTQRELESKFRPDPRAGLSRKDREAVEQMERLKAAGQLPKGRQAAIPQRRRKQQPGAFGSRASNQPDASTSATRGASEAAESLGGDDVERSSR